RLENAGAVLEYLGACGEKMNAMTNDELRDLVSGLTLRHSELAYVLESQAQETNRQIRETERLLKEGNRETDRQLRELKQQIGGLGEKFGSFTEGMAFPSMRKLLEQRFHMDVITLRALSRKNGSFLELDVLAYSNSTVSEVYIVEVK